MMDSPIPTPFHMRAKKLVVKPMKIHNFNKSDSSSEAHISIMRHFGQESHEQGFIHALVMWPVKSDLSVNLSSDIQNVLSDFSNLAPEQLPPMCNIHTIDLIPGASLPNPPTYRMSSREHQELQQQVQEVLDKGFIHESLSPYIVPARLHC